MFVVRETILSVRCPDQQQVLDLYTTTDVRLMSPLISRVLMCWRGLKRCLKVCVCIPLATILKE